MTEQSGRQRRETERMEIVIEHTEMVGNRRECHGKAGERWRRSEKIRYMTLRHLRSFSVYSYSVPPYDFSISLDCPPILLRLILRFLLYSVNIPRKKSFYKQKSYYKKVSTPSPHHLRSLPPPPHFPPIHSPKTPLTPPSPRPIPGPFPPSPSPASPHQEIGGNQI